VLNLKEERQRRSVSRGGVLADRVRARAAVKELSPARRQADYSRKSKYGLTREQFDRYVRRSQGRCCLCDRISPDLVVDHNHKSQRFRGLICDTCNRALMYVERHGYRRRWFRRVAEYLTKRGNRPSSAEVRRGLDKYTETSLQEAAGITGVDLRRVSAPARPESSAAVPFRAEVLAQAERRGHLARLRDGAPLAPRYAAGGRRH
jgi:recombination endonuclease VII